MSSQPYPSLPSLSSAETNDGEMASYLSFDMDDGEEEEEHLAAAFFQQQQEAGAVSGELLHSPGRFCGHDQSEMGWSSAAAANEARGRGSKIAFKTRSEVEVLDDGYRWRKYGKKMVKNSPNPRNYYRCSSEGCHVKKRVEREPEDSRYVITTYDGVHNHPAPAPGRTFSASTNTHTEMQFAGHLLHTMTLQGRDEVRKF